MKCLYFYNLQPIRYILSMNNIFTLGKNFLIKNYFKLNHPLKVQTPPQGVEKIGTDYGFAIAPHNHIGAHSIIYSVGAGLDLHFDIEIVRKYQCKVYIFDPTPGSIQHFEQLKAHVEKGEEFYSAEKSPYQATPQILEKITFIPQALWKEDTSIRFYQPEEEHFISHSITRARSKENYIEVDARKLSTCMRELGHEHIDFFKLDIEGAEYEVVDNILEENLDIRTIYLEYHFEQERSTYQNLLRIKHSLQKLESHGYRVIYKDRFRYFSLVKGNA